MVNLLNQTIWGPPLPNVTRHSGWWPHTVRPSIDRTLHQFLTITDLDLITEFDFYLIVQGFHRTYATGAACQQRTLTPPDTWSCPTLGLACVLMSRPISPELVLSPDFWISNIPRYFSFAYYLLYALLLYRYFIALREIYQNVCPEVPGNPRDVIFPDAEGGGKYNISGIPGNRGTNVLVYFPRSNEITVMLHFTRKNAWKIDPKF